MVLSKVVIVEVVSKFVLLSLESEKKLAFSWFSSTLILILSINLDTSSTLAFDVYLNCLY